jgi:steroid delta-isomerase-like uncharacterized protein
MDRAALRELAESWMRFWQGGGLESFLDLHDPAFVDRSAADRSPDREAFRDSVTALYRAFPDFHATIEAMVIDESEQSVAIRWTAAGSQRGAFMGHPPSGRLVRFAGIEIIGCRDGKVAYRWGEWDGIGILEQIHARQTAERDGSD